MNSKGKGLGLFSKLSRKSLSDLSEWNKNDEKLMQHIERSELQEIISLLKKKKVCSTKLDPQGHSALHVAAMRNKYDVVQLLIAYSANVTAVDFQGRTALHCAARHGASEVLEVLSHSKEDDWPRDENNMTALHQACIGGSLDCVINLIRKYPNDIKAIDEDGRTPLFYAAQIGHLNVCKELLDRGANVNTQDKFGRTALMCAAENGNRQISELFVTKGADITLCDQMGRTASWHAMDAGHTSVKQTIEPDSSSDPLTHTQTNEADYVDRHRLHSPIPEENESVMGEDDTLPLRFRSRAIVKGSLSGEDEIDGDLAELALSDNESQGSGLSYSETDEEDGSISPRLSELSYTMSQLKDLQSTRLQTSDRNSEKQSKSSHEKHSATHGDAQYKGTEGEPALQLPADNSVTQSKKLIMVTDLDAEDGTVLCQVDSTTTGNVAQDTVIAGRHEAASSSGNVKHISVTSTVDKVLSGNPVDVLMASEGISLSSSDSESSSDSDDSNDMAVVASVDKSSFNKPDTDLKKAHDDLITNYDNLKSDYEKMCEKLRDLEKDERRMSQEDLEVNERMEMVVQLGELSTKLDDERTRNKQLLAQITTLENLAGGASGRTQHTSTVKQDALPDGNMNWIDDFGGEYEEDSDDEFGFPGLCMLNNSTGKQVKEEVKPVAKVSGKQRQMSLKEENREIAKLKAEIEALDRQKLSISEDLAQLQSKYEESEHARKKLYSELDVCKSTLDVKSQENEDLAKQNEELVKSNSRYKDKAVAAVEQTKSYKKEVDRLGRKLELYDREYRKVKERLKRKDANEKRMLKDRQGFMKKMDESVRRMKESEQAAEVLRRSSHEEIDSLMVKCEELESEMLILKDFNEDQHYEIERLTELSSCNEEMYELKQQEIQSLEKQISLLKDLSATPQSRDSMRDSQQTVQSLQQQIAKLQSQLAETAAHHQETIEIYRNNLIMASKNLLDSDVKEAILYVIELRKPI